MKSSALRLLVVALLAAVATAPAVADDDKATKLSEAASQQMMAERALQVGEYARGLTFAEAALRLREATLAADDPLIADSALVVGIMRGKNGEQRESERLLTRALEIRTKRFAKDSPEVAAAQVALGELLRDAGDFVRAEPLLVRALASEEARGESRALANALAALAQLWTERDDPRCENMFRRAIALFEKLAGPDDVVVAEPVKALADMLVRRGDAARAEPLYRRAMAILEQTGDLGDPRRAGALLDFARVRLATGHAAEALALGGLAYTVDTKILGYDHPRVARDFLALAKFARATGDSGRAERYTWRAFSIRERVLGPEHPDVGAALQELAASYAARGDTVNATKLLDRALDIYRKTLGPKHPATAAALFDRAKIALQRKDVSAALDAMTQAGEIREGSLELLLYAGSERQKALYLATLDEETDAVLSLHAQYAPTNEAAARLAVLTLLRRKGRVLDTMADTFGALRARATSPQDLAALDRLAAARARLASVVLRGPVDGDVAAHATQIRALESEAQQAEAELGGRMPELRAGRVAVTLESVQAAIPEGSSLVELASYRPIGAQERRYIAYVLERTGAPRWVDLGTEAAVDALVRRVRAAFADPDIDPADAARAVDAAVMAPVRALLGGHRSILLSPDGQLNLVPFGALVDESGKFLVENYTITYLTTGRDLVRLAAPAAPSTQRALVVAAPSFGDAAEDAAGDQRRSFDLSDKFWPPLPGTVAEGSALKKVFGPESVIMGDAANETALKHVRAPVVLHVATHGFFLKDAEATADAPPTPATAENPLLRSGLALSGANRLASGKDDGILTALEASGLDLTGTQMVVLSACETGLGEVHNGEGVYGLRRAFVIAGAEAQLISLWEVNDDSTRDLMLGVYERLTKGVGRSEALRAAQLALLGTEKYRHPFYWAAFIESGAWTPIRGSLTPAPSTARVPPVARGARGCACDSGGSAQGTAVLALLVVLALARRPRHRIAAGALLALAVPLATADAAPATVVLPGSKFELAPADVSAWAVSDASQANQTWDAFEHQGAPKLSVLAHPVQGPTSCVLTLNLRFLDMLKGTTVVTSPAYLPHELYPDVLELVDKTGVTAMACAETPDGTVTYIVRYTGSAWATDALIAKPLLTAYAQAAAWGKGTRPTAPRTVTLATTGLKLSLTPSWREIVNGKFDVIMRADVGKPALGIGVFTDVISYPSASKNAKPRKKWSSDSCEFWEDDIRIHAAPDIQLVPRPAFVPATWHARASLVLDPSGDQLTVCHDTATGRWLATIEYRGAWTDAGLADATAILQAIAAQP